jgi:molecular chaperone DnaJ
MTDAVLGTSATLQGLDGEVAVEIKPGTQSADIVTVKDRGITRMRGGGRGDLKIGVQVVTPVRLNSKEQGLMKQFAESRRPVPPEFARFQQGLFAKLRDRFLNI